MLLISLSFGVVVEAATPSAPWYSLTVMIWAEVEEDPALIRLKWEPAESGDTPYYTVPDTYAVYRKTKDASSWGTPIVESTTNMFYEDFDVEIGKAYEYRVKAGNFEGYLFAGIKTGPVEHRGTVLLVVEGAKAEGIAAALDTFKLDLVCDGWKPIQLNTPAGANYAAVKNMIKKEYDADPQNVQAVFLLGRVPIFWSGSISPDGHESRPFAADAYYGSMTGTWNNLATINIAADVELMVGRVDFEDISGFGKNATELLNQYLKKNHRYRQGEMTVNKDGMINDWFGSGASVAQNAYRLYPALWGEDADIDAKSWYNAFPGNAYTWAHMNGPGNYDAVGVGHAEGMTFRSSILADPDIDTNAIFWQIFGSYNGDWADNLNKRKGDNLMMSALAMPDYGLASMWAGRPNWFFHHMAQGETIGYAARLTMNNIKGTATYTPTGSYHTAHVCLLGDPTLRMYPVLPATNARIKSTDNAVRVEWDASLDPEVSEYYIYGSADLFSPYKRLAIVKNATEWINTNPGDTKYYMVRACKLEKTGSGSFYNLAQGALAAYSVAVESGITDKPAAVKGDVVTISAFDAPSGKAFDKWISGDGIIFGDEYSSQTTFIMPDCPVTVAATFDTAYTIMVKTEGEGVAAASSVLSLAGREITLTATANDTYRFKQWRVISGDVTIADNKFIMPAGAVELIAVFEKPYIITVIGGRADKPDAGENTIINITAGPAPPGKVFDKWIILDDAIVFDDETSPNTFFAMLDRAITLEAVYKNIIYNIKVTGGSSSLQEGEYGASVTLTADDAPKGMRFKEWRVLQGGVAIADNTFLIGLSDIEIEAVWQDAASCASCGSITDITGGGISFSLLLSFLGIGLALLKRKNRQKAESSRQNNN